MKPSIAAKLESLARRLAEVALNTTSKVCPARSG
jgi:hypothetical protein